MDEVHFFGHVISAQGIAVDPTKVKAVVKWESPKSATEIRSFMELVGYYRKFIEGFSKIVAPMTQLTRKYQPFTWMDKCEESFQELKRRLTSALMCSRMWGSRLRSIMMHPISDLAAC